MAVPALVVFDLDACLWDHETYQLAGPPSRLLRGDLRGAGEGVVGALCGREEVRLHPGALAALQEINAGAPGSPSRCCAASSADTPEAVRIARALLGVLEVVPGVTVWSVLCAGHGDVSQIGRSPPLSADKSATHFPRIRAATGVRYDRMLFFDDDGWSDNTLEVATGCVEDNGKGVIAVKTGSGGLQERHWREGLRKFAAARTPA